MGEMKHPVNFVIPDKHLWPEIRDGRIADVSDEVLAQRCVGAINNWVIIPFIYFHRAGLEPRHAPRPVAGAINIASAHDLGIRERTVRAFIVCCRADAHLPELANFVFEQNQLRTAETRVAWTPHWPNPGLIRRHADRGARFETIAYKGHVGNLWREFRDERFLGALREIGVTLRLDLRDPPAGAPLRMHDYSDVDAVIAVRNLTEEDIKTKPASKLVNAWMGGAPALLGREPAFRELRRSNLDYIEIASPEGALEAIKKLKADSALCERMRQNGFVRARSFYVDELLNYWVELLNGPVAEAFEEWSMIGPMDKAVQFCVRAIREKQSRVRAQRHRYEGPRPFSQEGPSQLGIQGPDPQPELAAGNRDQRVRDGLDIPRIA